MWQLSPEIFKSGGTEGRAQHFARDVPGNVAVALEARERATVRASESHDVRERAGGVALCANYCKWKFRIPSDPIGVYPSAATRASVCTLSKVTAGAALSVGILRLNLAMYLGLNPDMAMCPFMRFGCVLRATRRTRHARASLNKPFATYGAFVSILIPSLLQLLSCDAQLDTQGDTGEIHLVYRRL